MFVPAVVAASVACCVPFALVIATRPALRALALRNARHAPGRAVLVVLGVVIATAVATSAGLVGDSLRASVRRSAVTQLGPVDEEVLSTGLAAGRSVQAAVASSAAGRGVGTLPLLSLVTTVAGKDFVTRVAQAQVLEVDFARARTFGGDAGATGMSGPTPTGETAVIGADLASALGIAPGHRVQVDAYGTSRTFAIDRVLPRRGIAGLAPVAQTPGSVSLDLFVPPGTIAAMLRAAPGRIAAAAAPPVSILAVSNRNRAFDRRESDLVSTRLRAATAGLGAHVEPVKQLLLSDADARSRRFTQLFASFGLFSVLGGILLLVLTFLMLARDRARSLGILRANGLRRSRHATVLALEGWIYAVAGALAGTLAGVGIAEAVVTLARTAFASGITGRVDLVFAARSTSIAAGWAIGLLASLVVVVSVAIAASRRNIVRLMAGGADPVRTLRPRPRRRLGAGLVVAGAALLAAGLGASSAAAIVVGPAIAASGAVLLASGADARVATSLAAASVFSWSALAVTVRRRVFTGLGVAVVGSLGVVMSACVIAFASVNRAAVTRRWSEPRPRRVALGLGTAYAGSARARTGLLVAMYAFVLFTLTLLVTVGRLYTHNAASVARGMGGAAALEVTSDATRPVPARDVTGLTGVRHVTPTRAIGAQLQDGTSTESVPVTVVGVDSSFIGHGSPAVAGTGAAATWAEVARDPAQVLVGADLHADRQSGLPGAPVRVGDTVDLVDPLTGTSRTATVAGLVEQARWAGSDHVFASRAVVDALNRAPAPANLLYVETAPGTNADVVAAVVDGTHLANGAYARSFRSLADDTLSAQRQFLDVGAAYATVGLLADIAGIAVLMVDRVRDRRRQIAMLRALGFRARTVRRAFRIEAAIIAAEGVVIGAATGLVLAWRLGSSGGLGANLAFSAPFGALAAIVGAVVVASLAATSVAARRAGRLRPAGALRDDA